MNGKSGSSVARDGEDVRKKWCNLKKRLQPKLCPMAAIQPGELGEGGSTAEDLSLLKQKIVSRMKKDAADSETGTSTSECPLLMF